MEARGTGPAVVGRAPKGGLILQGHGHMAKSGKTLTRSAQGAATWPNGQSGLDVSTRPLFVCCLVLFGNNLLKATSYD